LDRRKADRSRDRGERRIRQSTLCRGLDRIGRGASPLGIGRRRHRRSFFVGRSTLGRRTLRFC